MESNTSSQRVKTSYEDKLDEDILIDDFAGLDLKKETWNNPIIVFYGLDTTDRIHQTITNEICQIAAACIGNDGEKKEFKVYMKPEKYGIAPSVSVKKGYKMGSDGKLKIGENEVDASTQRGGLEMFLEFLSRHSGGTRSVLLAAFDYENTKYHRKILLRHMVEYNLISACQNFEMGFIYTGTVIKTRLLELAAELGPVLDPNNAKLFLLKNLAKKYLHFEILRERADVTVQAVMSLIICPDINCTAAMLVDSAFEFNFVVYILLVDLKRVFQPPAQVDFELTQVAIPNVQQNKVSLKTLTRIAEAGISSARLQTEYRDNNGDVSNLLQEITTKKAIRSINARLLTMANANNLQ